MSSYMEFGIDLGTTNSCIGRCEGDTVRIFQNNDLMNVTPSAVHITKTGRVYVGRKAYDAIARDAANIATEFKRAMGNKETKRFPATDRSMSPEELSAEVLKALCDDVKRSIEKDVTAAVVTVPAAFGQLQCDATARAGDLAGIIDGTLLQEPIAAAIAYGIGPGSKDQRWLVYDLGGGTLDIAVISTREGRLTVLEHKGDNLLGGKDIDRKLVETYLLPALAAQYALPDADSDNQRYQILLRQLALKAEEAKIELSTRKEVIVSIFDVGEDREGKEIVLELPLTRSNVEKVLEPMLQRTLKLADEALAAARMTGNDLSRVLLVGGPTQTPYLRAALLDHLKAPVDHSLDPMTVVAKGAALFAATVEVARSAQRPAAQGAVAIQLAFDPVSSSTQTTVAGKVTDRAGAKGIEIRIEAQAGYWDSGWIKINDDGYFEVRAVLQEGKICPFNLYARDASGKTLEVHPHDFVIRHGLELSAPPLPHTISFEVVRPNGRIELDPIFPRKTPLPAEARKSYRANRTLLPNEPGSVAVKLWEGEEFTEPEANTWVGNVKITSSMIRRPIPEGSDLDLFIRIDTSRLITVEVSVPHLNLQFSEGVYLAEQEQRSDRDTAARLTGDINAFAERLAALAEYQQKHPNADAEQVRRGLERELYDLDVELAHGTQLQNLGADPDSLRRLDARARDLRTQIRALEQRIGIDRFLEMRTEHAHATIAHLLKIVEEYGDALDRFEFEQRRKELEAAAERLDERAVRKCIVELEGLQFKILSKHDWYWQSLLQGMMQQSADAFINPSAAQHYLQEAERAVQEGNSQGLRVAVIKLHELLPVSARQRAQEQAAETILRA
jgi:molecular chaperone DnaK